MPAEAKKPAPKAGRSRRKSRELVLKGIYLGLMNQKDTSVIIRELADDPDFDRADYEYFRQLLEGVAESIDELDARLAGLLDRQVSELSPIEHAILCIAAYELIHDVTIPYRVAINEGVELAKLYGGTDGHKYVNGVLDKIAAEARPDEFQRGRR
ncbi:NusB antitermination factor [Methylobacillus flagellatus KT]|uniref:Transcription antitermination protein NusB n=2 Tax=Methylophilaceae TaxID=32011 RepID=NUSB_METFK|nr:RecName: Full=Transcription antitermination protein NusB; AltName: Full=Antitermination factor NusB [Methylobacillus flagellatus KT]ABE48763.1 NusB antitermination factor [Methylobacillus flagellatus KT]